MEVEIANGNIHSKTQLHDEICDSNFSSLTNFANSQHQNDSLTNYLPYLSYVSHTTPKYRELILKSVVLFPQLQTIDNYLLSIDWKSAIQRVEEEVRTKNKLKSLRSNSESLSTSRIQELCSEGSFVSRLEDQLTATFENGNEESRMRIFLSELFNLISFSQEIKQTNFLFVSEILSNDIYVEELCNLLPITLLKCPSFVKIKEVIKALLSTQLSKSLILSAVRNCPHQFHEILDTLLDSLEVGYSPILIGEILLKISEISLRTTKLIRQRLVERKILPNIVLSLTVKNLHDEIAFLSSVFNENSSWIKDYIQKLKPNESEMSLISNLREKLHLKVQQYQHPTGNVIEISSLLKIYCGLVGLLGIQLEKSEIETILQCISLNCSRSVRLSKLGLSFILICKGLLKSVEKSVVSLALQLLLKGGQISETMLLTAIQFHTNQITQIADSVRSTIGFSVQIQSESFNQAGELITQEILTEEIVAKESLNLPTIQKLNAGMPQVGSITCIYHLLKVKIFLKFKIDMSKWVFSQIMNCVEPMQPVMQSIIEEYVASCVNPGSFNFVMNRFSEESLRSVLIGNKSNSCPRVLILYYVLFYTDNLLKFKIEEKSRGSAVTMATLGYSRELLDALPIRQILTFVEKNRNTYSLYPKLLSLVVSYRPQLFGVTNQLMEEEEEKSTIKKFITKPFLTFENDVLNKENIRSSFENATENPLNCILVLKQLSTLLPQELWEHVGLLTEALVPNLLEPKIDHSILRIYLQIWNSIYGKYSWEMGLKFLNGVRMLGVGVFSHASLTSDLLSIFKVDDRLFRVPILVQIFIQILGTYMSASRRQLINQGSLLKKNDEMSMFILGQESAIVQVLLEICLLKEGDPELGIVEEIRVLICTFLHDLFIENPAIVKLVHFQGYHTSLLPITVSGIPSMHICLEFIPELLGHPNLEKQIFGILLASNLIDKYPIAKSLDLARLILTHIRNTSARESFKQLPLPTTTHSVNFLMEILPSLELLSNAFPLLTEDIVNLLFAISPSTGVAKGTIGYLRNPQLAEQISNTFNRITKKLLSRGQS